MDVDDVETLALNALGGADSATINDLAATDARNVDLDLGVNGAGDGVADALTVNGTVGPDVFGISGRLGLGGAEQLQPRPRRLQRRARQRHADGQCVLRDDVLSASGLAATSLALLTVNGGNDDDVLVGSDGSDALNGDSGTDYVNGGAGIDSGPARRSSTSPSPSR